MTALREAVQQALAFTMRDFASLRDFEAAKAVLYDILRAALAQQAEPVEPVAKVELMMTGGNAGLATRIVEIDHHLRDRLRPGQLLYTAPPKRQPLTDEQISDLWCEVSNTDFVTADTHVFARAVESKLQEKNT
jgi:hypothetical protein